MSNAANIPPYAASRQNAADDAPVILTRAEVEASEMRKSQKPKTIRQLPVFRMASNLSYYVAQLQLKCPRKMRCYVDQLECLTSELLRVLVLANEQRDQRFFLCSEAYATVVAIVVKMEILQKLHVISKDEMNKMRRMTDSVSAQIKGWQNSVNNQSIQ